MDSCMWQTISKTDFLHPSHMWEHGTALRTWVCSKTQTLLDTLKTRNQPQEESCVFLETEHLSSPNVHETNCCLAQFYIVGDYFMDAGLRMVGLLALDLWDVVTEVVRSTSNTVQPKHTRIQEIGATLHFLAKTQVPKGGRSSNWMMWILYPQTFFSRCVSVVHFWGQRSSDQDDYQRMKPKNETHVQNPQSCSGLVDRQDQFGTQDPDQICWDQNQLADIVIKEVSRDVHGMTLFVQ